MFFLLHCITIVINMFNDYTAYIHHMHGVFVIFGQQYEGPDEVNYSKNHVITIISRNTSIS